MVQVETVIQSITSLATSSPLPTTTATWSANASVVNSTIAGGGLPAYTGSGARVYEAAGRGIWLGMGLAVGVLGF